MSALPDLDYEAPDRPEISNTAFEKIDRWRVALDQTPKIDKRSTFEAAAADLYAEAQHETDLAAFQSIEDDIRILGQEHAGLDAVDVDYIMVGAKFDAGGARSQANGHAAVDEPPPAKSSDDYGTNLTTIEQRPASITPATFITPAAWPDEAPPPVDWLVAGRIPRGDVTTLHGDGGTGKTDITTLLAADVARGAQKWLGHDIAHGPAIFISAEEHNNAIWRRVWMHAQRDGYAMQSVTDLHLWFPGEGGDTVLALPDRSGIMRPTRLMYEIGERIASLAPAFVAIDNVAATYGGSQIDRLMARSYVNLWRTVAQGPGKPAVLLLDHPRLSGLSNGTGRGGNMDWRNSVRSAQYMRNADDKAEADRGVKILETVKNNYGPLGNPVRLVWGDYGFQLEHAPNSLHRLAKDTECEETFLRLLDERNAQGRYVGDKNGRNYAPAIFAEMADNGSFTAKAFARAMDRLFEARKIALRSERIDGKPRNVIDRAANVPPSAPA